MNEIVEATQAIYKPCIRLWLICYIYKEMLRNVSGYSLRHLNCNFL